MTSEDLEQYESKNELELYQEYRDVISMFRFVVESDRRLYLANEVVRTSAPGDSHVEYELNDAWVWDMYRTSRFLSKVTLVSARGISIEELPAKEL